MKTNYINQVQRNHEQSEMNHTVDNLLKIIDEQREYIEQLSSQEAKAIADAVNLLESVWLQLKPFEAGHECELSALFDQIEHFVKSYRSQFSSPSSLTCPPSPGDAGEKLWFVGYAESTLGHYVEKLKPADVSRVFYPERDLFSTKEEAEKERDRRQKVDAGEKNDQ